VVIGGYQKEPRLRRFCYLALNIEVDAKWKNMGGIKLLHLVKVQGTELQRGI
jgi:hypothetical protein